MRVSIPPEKGRGIVLGILLLSSLAVVVPSAWAAQLGATSGVVEIGRGEPPSWTPARSGQRLEPGQRVRTGRGGHAEVNLNGATVRLYENSLLRLPTEATSGAPASGVRLERGSSLFDVIKRKLGATFDVETPQVVVSVKGTRFAVDLLPEAAQVAVFRGVVGVRPPGFEQVMETMVRAGFMAHGGDGRPFELEVSMTDDPWERWLEGTPADLREGSWIERRKAADERALAAARESADRRNDGRVMKHAAARSPELAQRMREVAKQREQERADGRGDAAPTLPPPAKQAMETTGNAGRAMADAEHRAAVVAELQKMRPDPDDLMEYVEKRIAEMNGGMNDTSGKCMGACPNGPVASRAFHIVKGLDEHGMKMGDAEKAVRTAIQTIGMSQLQSMLRSGSDASTLEPLFESTFTGSMGLSDETSDLLIGLMYLQFQRYIGDSGGTP